MLCGPAGMGPARHQGRDMWVASAQVGGPFWVDFLCRNRGEGTSILPFKLLIK